MKGTEIGMNETMLPGRSYIGALNTFYWKGAPHHLDYFDKNVLYSGAGLPLM
jgi:hypothetical protein